MGRHTGPQTGPHGVQLGSGDMDWFSIPIRVVTWPPQKFNRWTKKRGSDRNAQVREGSEILTPVIDTAQKVGPGGIIARG
jgi:hypothetical protein